MFKKFSCVAFGVVAASLVSAVEPAQAFSFRSNSSSYTSSFNSGSFNSFSAPTNSYGQSAVGTGSTNLLAKGTQIGGVGSEWLSYAFLPLLIWMFIEGLEEKNNSDTQFAKVLDEAVDETPLVPDFPDDLINPSVSVPSPALLPGLVGMGVAAMRKRNRTEASEQA